RTSSPSLKVTSVSSPVICDRTETVWNASAVPMTLIAIGIGFWTATAVFTGTGAPGGPPPRPAAAGVDCTASLPEHAIDTITAIRAVTTQAIRAKLTME